MRKRFYLFQYLLVLRASLYIAELAEVLMLQYVTKNIALRKGISSEKTSTRYGCRSMMVGVHIYCQDVNFAKIKGMRGRCDFSW